jgi:hypothetical protein
MNYQGQPWDWGEEAEFNGWELMLHERRLQPDLALLASHREVLHRSKRKA